MLFHWSGQDVVLRLWVGGQVEQVTLRGRIVSRIKIASVRRENPIDRAYVGGKQQIARRIAFQFPSSRSEQRAPVERVLANGCVSEKVVEARRDIGESGQSRVVENDLTAHLCGQVHDKRNPHHLRPNRSRVAVSAKLSGRVSMVAGDDDDAVVIHSMLLEIGKELTET